MHPSQVPTGQLMRVEGAPPSDASVKVRLLSYKEGLYEFQTEPPASVPEEFQRLGHKVVVAWPTAGGLKTLVGVSMGLIEGRLTVEVHGEFRTQQLRQYFRAPFTEKVQLQVLAAQEASLRGKREEVWALDLSAGGMQVNCSFALQTQDTVHLQFPLGLETDKQRPVMSVGGTVKRCVPTARKTFTVGIEFQALSMRDQDRLVAFLLKKQAAASSLGE